MRLTAALRHLLEGYLVALAILAALAAAELLLGGPIAGVLSSAIPVGLFVMMFVWLAVAYFSGASPGTYISPGSVKMAGLSQSGSLVLPEDNPEVMEDLKEKLMGEPSDIMMWAGGNAGLCFGLGILFLFIPVAALVCLVAAVAAILVLLVVSR